MKNVYGEALKLNIMNISSVQVLHTHTHTIRDEWFEPRIIKLSCSTIVSDVKGLDWSPTHEDRDMRSHGRRQNIVFREQQVLL